MAGTIKGITVKIGGDTTELSKALKDVNSAIDSNKKKLKELNQALKFDPKNVELLKQKQELLNESIAKTKEKIETLKKAQEQAAQDMKNGVEGSKEKYDTLTVEISKAESSLKGLETQAKNTNDKIKSLNFDGLDTAGKKMTDIGNKMTDVGKKVSVVSAAFAALGAAAVAAFNVVDEGADNVIKKTGATGAAAEELNAVYEQVASSVVGEFSDIGNVVGELNTRFGLTGNELETLSEEFMRFSTITEQNANSAVVGVAKAMNIFNVDASDCANVLGLLAKTAQVTGIDVSTLENLLQSNAATFQEMGLGLTEAVQLMGTFEAAGADSATVLTALKKAATNYSKEGKSMSEGLDDLIARLQNSSTAAEATKEAYSVFGARAGLTFINLAKQGKISFSNLSKDLSQYATVVQDTYNETLDGADAVQLSWQKAKLAASQLGDVLDKKLGSVAEKLGKKIERLAEWFDGLTESQVELIVKIGAVIAIGGPLLIMIGKLTTAIGTMFSLIAAHPIGALITALGLATAGIIAFSAASSDANDEYAEFNSKAEKVRKSLEADIEARKESITQLNGQADASRALYSELEKIVDENGKIAEGDETRAQVIVDQLNSALGTEITIVDGIVAKWEEVGETIDQVIQKQLQQALIEQNQDAVTDAYANRAKSLSGWAEAINQYAEAESNAQKAANSNVSVLSKEWESVATALKYAKTNISTYTEEYGRNITIINSYTDLQTAILEGDYEKMQTATDNFMNALSMTPEEYKKIGEDAAQAQAEALAKTEEQFDVTLSSIERGTKATNDSILTFLTQLGEASDDAATQTKLISKAIENNIITEEQATKLGEAVGSGVSAGIKNKKVDIATEAGDAADRIENPLDTVKKNAKTWGSDLGGNLSKGMDNSQGLVSTSAEQLANIIRARLHFTKPDVGPLSDFDTYMPDMVKLMAQGIKDNKWRVMQEAQGLAGELSYTLGNLSFTPTINNQNDIYLDSMPIASQVNRVLGAQV